MLSVNEYQIALYAAGVIIAANLLAMGLFVLYVKLPDSRLRESIKGSIFELDKIADNMEKVEKRRAAIQQINEILGWRRILVPGVLIGWIIDAEVAAVRKMQKAAGMPDLHNEVE